MKGCYRSPDADRTYRQLERENPYEINQMVESVRCAGNGARSVQPSRYRYYGRPNGDRCADGETTDAPTGNDRAATGRRDVRARRRIATASVASCDPPQSLTRELVPRTSKRRRWSSSRCLSTTRTEVWRLRWQLRSRHLQMVVCPKISHRSLTISYLTSCGRMEHRSPLLMWFLPMGILHK